MKFRSSSTSWNVHHPYGPSIWKNYSGWSKLWIDKKTVTKMKQTSLFPWKVGSEKCSWDKIFEEFLRKKIEVFFLKFLCFFWFFAPSIPTISTRIWNLKIKLNQCWPYWATHFIFSTIQVCSSFFSLETFCGNVSLINVWQKSYSLPKWKLFLRDNPIIPIW